MRVIRRTGRENRLFSVQEPDYAGWKLEDGDAVTVGAILDRFANRVEIRGSVYRPGMYELGGTLNTVKDLVARANGLTGDAFQNRVLLTREREDLTHEVIAIDLAALLAGRVPDIPLQREDVLVIPSIHELEAKGAFTVSGEVTRPGIYPYVENTTLEDLLVQAGGLLESASTVKVDVSRRIKDPESTEPGSELSKIFTFSVKEGYVIDGTPGFVLEPFDVVEVRRSPGYQVQRRVTIAGEAVPEGMVPLLEQHFRASAGTGYIPTGTALIRNSTSLPDAEVAAEVGQPLPFSVEKNSSEPQVLIVHTHATECYEGAEHSYTDPAFSARTTDTAVNMVAVGQQMTDILNAAGINTLHDTTLHDYPSYTGSYEKSNATVRSYLQQYPSIKVVIDVHRDAIQRADGTRVKPVVTINGEKSAQVMLISCADQDGNLPNYKQNLRFAAAWQAQMEGMFPGLTRPVLFDYRYYNQDLSTGSLLLEVGGHANTLSEALAAGRMAAQALAQLFSGA